MKILYFFEEKNTFMDQWQRYHIFNELELHGVEVIVFNPLDFNDYASANSALLKEIETQQFDLFMTPHNEKRLFISTLMKIKKHKLPTLLICFDNLVIPFEHKNVCSFYDLVWLTSIETEYLFKKWGAKTIFLPYAANPNLFKSDKQPEVNKICFVGTPYGSRVNTLNTLIDNNIPVALFSKMSDASSGIPVNKQSLYRYLSPFINLIKTPYGRKIIMGAFKQKLKPPRALSNNTNSLKFLDSVDISLLGKVYSSYALSLSSTAARNTGVLKRPLNIVNLRSFEIPMSGGLQICPYSKELASYFVEDKEIIFYRTECELIEKSNYYLLDKNKLLRQKIKAAARKRAIQDHSWFNRFQQVFDYFSLTNERSKYSEK